MGGEEGTQVENRGRRGSVTSNQTEILDGGWSGREAEKRAG